MKWSFVELLFVLCFQLEKEAQVKGVPIGQAIDIEIPPPRPKRKPSNPYPRKTDAISSPNTQVRAKDPAPTVDHVMDLAKEQLLEVCLIRISSVMIC